MDTNAVDQAHHWLLRIGVGGLRGFAQEENLVLAVPTGAVGSGLTLVVGANNSGKSTIWEAFEACARSFKNPVSFSEGRRNRQSKTGVKITLQYASGVEYQLGSRSPDTSETVATWTGDPLPAANREIVSVPSRRQFQATFGRNQSSDRAWMSTGGEYTRSRQFDQFHQFTGRLFDVHNDPVKKARFDKLMTEVLGYPLEWTIDLSEGQNGQSYYLKVAASQEANHTSEGLGDGIISLLFILNALYDSDPATLLVIDEPELSLHPQLVRRLGLVVARFASDRQIVVFTHSPALVRWGDIASGARIARTHIRSGRSAISQPSTQVLADVLKARGGWKNPHALGTEANEILFLDDGVIVVEGQDDAGLLPRAFEQVGIDISGVVLGWGSGGASNIDRYLALLVGLGFERVVAMLDGNVEVIRSRLEERYPQYLVRAIPADDIRDKPAESRLSVKGLFDERGHRVHDEFLEATREVLGDVAAYFAPRI